MRLSLQLIPVGLLVLLAPYSTYNGWHILQVLLGLFVIALVRQALTLYTVVSRKLIESKGEGKIILETIHASHYAEKVRWCMDYLDIPYEEEQDVGILGLFLLGRGVPVLRIPSKNISIANSSDILRYLYSIQTGDKKKKAFLEPTEEAVKLEKILDKLGENIRRYLYAEVFKCEDVDNFCMAVWGMHQRRVPYWQKGLLRLLLPILRHVVIHLAKTSPEEVQASKKAAMNSILNIETRLADGRLYLLSTSGPTYIDFVCASMINFLVMPDEYGGHAMDTESKMTTNKFLSSLPDVKREVETMRQRPIGKYIKRMFKEHRYGKQHEK